MTDGKNKLRIGFIPLADAAALIIAVDKGFTKDEGLDPDQDLRVVVLPPPYMVESISSGHVDGFCVGAPWNSVAVDLGIAHILHFSSEIQLRAAEKVLAVRASWAKENPDTLRRLMRAHGKAADFVEEIKNREEASEILSAPNRISVAPVGIRRTSDGKLKN